MDDIGVDSLPQYNDLMVPEPTLNGINEIFSKGLKFDTAWATAWCSSTRTMLHTGQYPFRTGIGRQILNTDSISVDVNALIFPKMLDDLDLTRVWQHALVGKWHMSDKDYRLLPVPQAPPNSPVNMGYSFHEGHMFGVDEFWCDPMSGSWDAWTKFRHTPTVGPLEFTAMPTDNLTTDHFDVMENWITTIADDAEPLFAVLALIAPFELYRKPPAGTFSVPIPDPGGVPIANCDACRVVGATDPRRDCYVANIESLDYYLELFLRDLDDFYGAPWENNINIILIGDNGTPGDVTDINANTLGAKGDEKEAGIRIPFVFAGPDVATVLQGTSTDALISVVDIFATLASLANIDISSLSDIDSIDQSSILDGSATTDPRTYLFSEVYTQNYVTTSTTPHVYGREDARVARTKNFKYVYYPKQTAESYEGIFFNTGHRKGDLFFDMTVTPDPEDTANNLLGTTLLDPVPQIDHDLLLEAITDLLYPGQ